MNTNERPVQSWKIADLREHPRQQELFGDLPDAQLDELIADMKINGQRVPLDILPTGEIADGHQRWRAAKKLDWSELNVIIRDDLAVAGDAALEKFMIDVNMNRRHLDVLAIARLYKRLRQLDRGLDKDKFTSWCRQDLRDRLAKRIGGRSGRTLDRYVQLLDAPRVVQDAVSRGALSMQAALKMLRLRPEKQEAVVAAISAGKPANKVIAANYPTKPNKGKPIAAVVLGASAPARVSDLPQKENTRGILRCFAEVMDIALGELIRANLTDQQKIAVVIKATAVLKARPAE